jgi:hypothetical protein
MPIRRTVLLGIANWGVVFGAAVALSPIKEDRRLLFESLMPVVLAASTTVLAMVYYRGRPEATFREGILLGFVWAAISVGIDLPLVLPAPMSMPIGEYLADVAATYLIMPIITAGLAAARERHDGGV